VPRALNLARRLSGGFTRRMSRGLARPLYSCFTRRRRARRRTYRGFDGLVQDIKGVKKAKAAILAAFAPTVSNGFYVCEWLLCVSDQKGDMFLVVLPPLPRQAVPFHSHTPLTGLSLPPLVGMPSFMWRKTDLKFNKILWTCYLYLLIFRLVNLS